MLTIFINIHFYIYIQNKISPNIGTLLNGVLTPKLLNSPFASWFSINLDFLLPHVAHFDNVIALSLLVLETLGFNYFVLNFILILCHLQVTGYEDRISLLYDYIILGFKYYSIKFINSYIMLELIYYKNNSFIKVSVIANANWYRVMAREIGVFLRKSKIWYPDRI